MLSYLTALKLKEAGFPQKPPFPFSDKDKEELLEKGFDPDIHFPTLEELIEACGERFDGLIKNRGPLATSETGWSVAGGSQIGLGATPTEAVANLWLALNT